MFNDLKPEQATQPEQPAEEVVSDEAAEPDEKGAFNKYKKKEAKCNPARRKWRVANEKCDRLVKEVEAAQESLEKSAEAEGRYDERLSKTHLAESALDEARKLHKTLVALRCRQYQRPTSHTTS